MDGSFAARFVMAKREVVFVPRLRRLGIAWWRATPALTGWANICRTYGAEMDGACAAPTVLEWAGFFVAHRPRA